MKALLEKIRKILRDRKVRRALTRMVGSTSAVVVFVTTYALILPAITLEREAMCGIEAHQHDESCYSEELICEIPESDGHHHTDECYTVTRELICKLGEHVHSVEDGCYDEEGNLICELQEHQHDASCYEEARTLTCGQEESDGHHHGPECYEKVLTCGKEAHTHSEECYKDESSAVAPSSSSPTEAVQSETTYVEETDESAAGDATTDVLPEEMAEENLSEGLVPSLDPLYMDAMLTKDTAFYYYHPEEGEIVEDSSIIDRWEKADRGTELEMTDLVKIYLPYTIPAGSLNQTNQIARFRLPYNLHLTDEQIKAINRNENGVAASVTDSDVEQDNSGYGSAYEKYLGAEAVEGKRKPNEELQGGDTEYISAVVKAENVYNESTGEYEGQDLIFIFTPYTIEENQDVYDQDGNMTAKGRKVSGWFAVDFNMSQIDWVEDESDADLDNTTIGKTAEFIFAEKEKEHGADEIRRELKLVEKKTEDDSSANMTTEEAEEEETSAEAETSAAAEEATSESTTENAAEAETAAAGETTDAANADNTSEEFTSGTLETTGDGYKITLDYTAEAKIPADADLQVREITEASDKEAYEACLAEARKQVTGDDKSAVDQKASRFFDIEIIVKGTDESGKKTITKIEPAAPVSVNIQLANAAAASTEENAGLDDGQSQGAQASDPTVLHFADEGVETIDSTVETSEEQDKKGRDSNDSSDVQPSTTIQFEADSFSVYGVVYTTITKTFITASGESYKITVTYDEDAEIPQDAELNVREIEEGTAEYSSYLSDSASELNAETDDISFARFFDIEITDKAGTKIEPKSPVTVQIGYSDAIDFEPGETLSVVHFADKGTEVIDNVGLNNEADTITYTQESFSVTGTVVNGAPRNGQQYMLIVEYQGEKYIINNDGTLIPVDQVIGNDNQIKTEYPMLWTYYYQYGAHFRFASEASGFNSDQTASGFYYRYLDPASESGLTEEDQQHPHLEGSTQINYNNNKVNSANNNNLYIGVSNEGGTLHITGQENSRDAAQITLYSADQVRPSDPANHTVNHIDISISGSAEVDVPLAYGIYYYKDSAGNWKKIIVGTNVEDVDDGIPLGHDRYTNHTEALIANQVGITSDDMKNATIKAYETKTVNGEQVPDLDKEVHDAFYITGYSANETTQWSTDQVRIEGSFKVSTMNPVNGNNWWEVNSPATRHERKSKAITYTVEATKKLELPLTYTDDLGNKYQLYQSTTDNEPITITADVPMSASFNYWTDIPHVGNECPPLQQMYGYRDEWKDGGIHPYGISGMDFVLTSHVVNVPAKIEALEITKKIVREDGTVIDNLTSPIETKFEVYQDKPGDPTTVREVGSEVHDYGSYKKLHDHNVTIGTNGNGHKFDYNVSDGMYYVRESREGMPSQITTADGHTYTYIRTEIKTEYAYRANQYRVKDADGNYISHQMHETTITSPNANLNSIPEVLGDYKDDHNQDETNEFLEFYFYNVYSETQSPPPPEPVYKTLNIELDKKWQDGSNTAAPEDGSITFYLHQIQTQNGNSAEVQNNEYPKSFTIRAEDGWKLTIPDLPWYETDTHDNYVKTYKYYLEEDVSKATGSAALYGAPSFTNGFGSINKPIEGDTEDETIPVEVVNKTGNVIRIQKRWINIDPNTAPNVTVDIWRQKIKPDNQSDGDPVLFQTIVLNNNDLVNGENWWMRDISFPTERPVYQNWNNSQTSQEGDYAYFISERNPDGTNNNDSNAYLKPRYFKLTGDQVIDDFEAYGKVNEIDFGNNEWNRRRDQGWNYNNQNEHAYVKASDAQDSTLIVMNAPKDSFQHVKLFKTWFKYNSNGQLVQASSNDVKNYAVGLQVYQRLKQNGAEWAPFANPFYISTSTNVIDCNGATYINEDNPFQFEYMQDDNGVWKWQFIQYDGIRNGFPRYGLVNGTRVEYEYEVREFGVYTGNHASTADQLTRVYDYTNEQEWAFDEQHKDAQNDPRARGINVSAGKLKVTKTWQGGHMGSRIYFEVYRGNENITSQIVADPESYHLTEYQVYEDETHQAIIVTCDGTNWEEVLIEGLRMGPSGGGSPYQYSIKEIGYSEADGTNCWDGETIIESDGSVRKDPHGNDIVVDISDLLTGYVIDGSGSPNKTQDGKSNTVNVTGETPHTIQVNNTYEEKYTNLEFTKVWENSSGDFLTWPKDENNKDVIITVQLFATDDAVLPVAEIPLYITPPEQTSKREFTWDGVTYEWEVNIDPSGTIYSFRIPNLPVKSDDKTVTYSYSIIEKNLDGYETHYGQIEENSVQIPETDGEGNPVYEEDGTTQKYKTVIKKQFADENLERITNGKVISNKKEEPQTGTLNITKAVSEGSDASGKTFSFEVTLKNADDSAFTGAINVTDSTRQASSATPDDEGKIVVTVTGTGTAVITDIPAGIKYTVSEPTSTIPSGWKQEGTVAVTGGNADQIITTGETETATITNTPTDFEFSKVWKNANGTQYDTWQKDITVTLYRKSKKSGSAEETVKVFSIANGTAAINPELNTSYNADISINGGGAPETGKENKGYKYTITGAGLAAYDSEGYEYDYYVKEADVTFYTTTYGVFDGEGDTRTPRAVDGYSSAADGGVIINTPVEAYELPSTGGPGTHLFYLLGSALAIFAAVLLGMRRIRH